MKSIWQPKHPVWFKKNDDATLGHQVGEKIRTKLSASAEYRDTEGTIVRTPSPTGKGSEKWYGVSLVSDNGTRGTWAVPPEEIED